ncbi:NUDIX domain-containing protein [Teredinibacter waterburyi]|uniref:NUDIX domain-containing protein n=1 Tax=Teredinibacter waterburyi TaxID=1500538 RepID=UPI00165F0901|nr:NUDIX domain-containing protein [Teredinibacter waterburyi]
MANPLEKTQYGKDDFEVEDDKIVYDGFFKMYHLRLKHKTFAGGWLGPISRELFHRGEAAAAIVYDRKQDLVGLIEQFRIGALDSPYGPWCLETVAGMMEPGESGDGLIARELEEEAGIVGAELVYITSYYSSPGGCNEKIHLYCALCDLTDAGGHFGLAEEHEDIRFSVHPAEEVFATMYSNRTNNAATLLGLQWLQLNRSRLREQSL